MVSKPENNTFYFSDKNEIEAQRRRRGSGPRGRAEQPVFRPPSGTSGGSGGGWQGSSGGSGGGFPLPTGGMGGGGLRIRPWMIIVGILLLLIFGGKGLLGGGGDNYTTYPTEEPQGAYQANEPQTAATPVSGFTPPAGAAGGSWTVMLYQDADDQVLEQDIYTDLNEVELVGSTNQVNIIAQIDRYRGGYAGADNWSSTRRYYVTQDNDLTMVNSQLVADLGEQNMASAATLVDFIEWSIQNFPADHYLLVMSDHGMGWPGGWLDSSASGSSESAPLAQKIGNALYLDQLDEALAQVRQDTGLAKLDIIGMDACLMGQVEVLSALEPYANYAIFSEESEPALGWAYAAFLQPLVQNPGMSAADLSRLVVQSYISEDQRIVNEQARQDLLYQMGRGYASAAVVANALGKDSTLSAVDLSKVPALTSSLNALAYALQSAEQSEVAAARTYAQSFTSIFSSSVPPSFIDLGNFVQILAQQSNNNGVRQASSQVLGAIRSAVIAEKHGSGRSGATGISIYFPNSALYRNPYAGPQSYTVVASRFSEISLWDDFLAFHYNDRSFDANTREAVVPSSGYPSRAPGAGQISVSPIRLSSDSAAPNQPVTMRADISGNNIGNIYLLVGFYDSTSNYIFLADTDFLESPDTRQVDGVYYPQWGSGGDFTVKFDWDPILFTISDGTNETTALFTPQQYGATAADATYSVDGTYTFSDTGNQQSARLYFRDGELVSVYGITGEEDTGAPREILPRAGDTFTPREKWLQLDSNGSVTGSVYQDSDTTLTFSDQAFTWQETYAPAGEYLIGFIVTDLDGNSTETYSQISIQ